MPAPEWKPQIYHLPTDPGDSKNLAAEKPDLMQELHTAWQA